ncbi:MAG: hypothetical protein ABI912_08745 [Actinomycetota bacterium]
MTVPSTRPADPFGAVAALPLVAQAAESARASVDAALSHNLMRRRSAEVTVEAGLRSARATAALEGADLPLEGFRRWSPDAARVDAAGLEAAGLEAATVSGALRLTAELGTVRGALERAPLQAFARLHLLAGAGAGAGGAGAADSLGRPRSGPVGDDLQLGQAPAAAEVAARLTALAELLVARTSAPALVVAALVQGELLALRPFAWGNGLVARAAGRLVLVSRGLDVKAVTAPEVGHADDPAAYRAAALAYIAGDVTTWVLHCAHAVELGARETLAICAAIERQAAR